MQIQATVLPGVWRLILAPHRDARGEFMRTLCRDTLCNHGLVADFPQCNLVRNRQRGVLRGLHFQREPHAETKLVHCLLGQVFDVVADLRPESATYGQHATFELDGARDEVLYVPAGCAHGYQTRSAESLVYYHMSHPHTPTAEGQVRWDDPRLRIAWPTLPPLLSPRDAAAAPFAW